MLNKLVNRNSIPDFHEINLVLDLFKETGLLICRNTRNWTSYARFSMRVKLNKSIWADVSVGVLINRGRRITLNMKSRGSVI